jgi:pimeloyl-ACP methyl ester carboxylesterase
MRRLLRYAPIARWFARNQVAAYWKDPVAYLDRGLRSMPAPDRVVAEDPVRRAYGQAQISEFNRTPEPWFDEWRAVVGPWAADLSAITARLMIVHGEQDHTTPVAMARWMAERMPTAELRIDPDRGHFIAADRLAAVLAELVAPTAS